MTRFTLLALAGLALACGGAPEEPESCGMAFDVPAELLAEARAKRERGAS